MKVTPNVSGSPPLFKLSRILMWSLHSFYSMSNFCVIYSFQNLEFANLAAASSTSLLFPRMHCKYTNMYHTFQGIFVPLQLSANITCKTDKKFTGNKIHDLNHTGMSYGNRATPSTQVIPLFQILLSNQSLRTLVYMSVENSGLGL